MFRKFKGKKLLSGKNYFFCLVNFLDIIIAIPLIYGAYKGFRNGFIMEVFSILALFVGLYAAFNFSDQLTTLFVDTKKEEPQYLPAIIFIVLLIGVGVGVYFAGKALEKIVKAAMLSTPNRIAGGIIGTAKFLYFTGSTLMFIVSMDKKESFISPETKENSLLYALSTDFVSKTIPGATDTYLYQFQSPKVEEEKPQNEEKHPEVSEEDLRKAKELADDYNISEKEAIELINKRK
jgi:membrane protein required for colicin V production